MTQIVRSHAAGTFNTPSEAPSVGKDIIRLRLRRLANVQNDVACQVITSFDMMLALVLGFALSQQQRPVSLTEDGHVRKVIVRDGSGPSPETNQQATIKYVGHLPDGTVFDESQGAFQFKLGHGVIPGWSVGVASMKVGEIAKFSINYDYGYGERGYPPVVPGKSELTYEIELLNVQ